MRSVEVLEPGASTTVQDLGREGHEDLGVAASGAADELSLRAGNRLVGNPDGAPALEATLLGPTLRFRCDAVASLAGAPSDASLDGRPVPPWTAFRVVAGAVLRTGRAAWGVRTLLCVAGGLEVPRVLGSASTHAAAGFGGLEGRALRAGDVLPLGPRDEVEPRVLSREAVAILEGRLRRPSLRATPGAHASSFDAESVAAFWSGSFAATDRTDRMGARLAGPSLRSPLGGTIVTEGMPRGAVQVTPSGETIVLLPDGPTTGGYPVVACVATVDHARLGQLRPHDRVSFERVSPDEARALWLERERWLDEALPPA